MPWSLEGLLARGGGSLAGLPVENRAAATLRLQVARTPAGLLARLRRQTMIRFGTAAADSVSDALRGGTTETELDRIDDWIVECGSADELLARLRAG